MNARERIEAALENERNAIQPNSFQIAVLETLLEFMDALESVAAEKCNPSVDEQLPKLNRAKLISVIDTDTRITREALASGRKRLET